MSQQQRVATPATNHTGPFSPKLLCQYGSHFAHHLLQNTLTLCALRRAISGQVTAVACVYLLVLSFCALLNSWCVYANPIPQVAERHGLTEGDPVPHVRAQVLEYNICIIHKVLCKLLLKETPVCVLQKQQA